MKLIQSEDSKAVYSLETPNYTIEVTLLDMGNYVGHRERPFGNPEPQIWKTMSMEIQLKDGDKKFHVENLVDDKGRLLRTLIEDKDTNTRRIRQYYYDFLGVSQERITQLRGPGTYWDNGRWVQDDISVWKDNFPSESFYYDNETGLFIEKDEKSNHTSIKSSPEGPLANPELTEKIELIGYKIEGAFNKERLTTNKNPEEILVPGIDAPAPSAPDNEEPEL